MKIKPALHALQLVQMICIVLSVAGIYYYIKGFRDPGFLFFAITAVLAGALLVLFKKQIIRWMLTRVSYPGIFFDLCERMQLTGNVPVNESDAVLDALYYPQYSTAQFLADNDLQAEVRAAHPVQEKAVSVAAVVLMVVSIPFPWYMSMWALPLYLLMAYLVRKAYHGRGKGRPQYAFTEAGLATAQALIPWTQVYNWSLSPVPRKGVCIILQLKEPAGNAEEIVWQPGRLSHTRVELLMLLAHYKYKYGNMAEL